MHSLHYVPVQMFLHLGGKIRILTLQTFFVNWPIKKTFIVITWDNLGSECCIATAHCAAQQHD